MWFTLLILKMAYISRISPALLQGPGLRLGESGVPWTVGCHGHLPFSLVVLCLKRNFSYGRFTYKSIILKMKLQLN